MKRPGGPIRVHRKDENHDEIVARLEAYGCKCRTTNLGDGFPDIICGVMKRNYLFEIKVPGGLCTPKQVDFISGWPGQVTVIHSFEEARAVITGSGHLLSRQADFRIGK